MKRNKYFALPHVIIPGEWDIVPSSLGACNVEEYILQAPSGEDEWSIAVRIHEYLHIRFSPEMSKMVSYIRDGMDIHNIKAFEDCRVTLKAKKLGLDKLVKPIITPLRSLDSFGGFGDAADPMLKLILCFHLASHGEDYKEWGIFLGIKQEEIFETYWSRIKSSEDDIIALIRAARDFSDLFRHPPDSKMFTSNSVKELSGDNALNDSGIMEIIDFLPMRRKPLIKEFINTESGFILRHPERFVSDKRVFVEKNRRKKIGTILIDCSGSMNISLPHLKRIVELSHGATIGGYSGENGGGSLWILSKRGRVVKELPVFPIGNVIDYPALLWLAGQERPWIWVSDGGVSGKGDNITTSISAAVHKLVHKHNIEKIRDLEGLEEYIKEKSGIGRRHEYN